MAFRIQLSKGRRRRFCPLRCRLGAPSRDNGLKLPVPLRKGGHNNIKSNPVFRGMVRHRTGLQTKETCD